MKPLAGTYNKNGYLFNLVEREGDIAIYSQELDRILAYEVFEVQKVPEGQIKGVWYEAREATPGNEAWGRLGYTVGSFSEARKKATILQERAKSRNLGNPSCGELTLKYWKKVG